MISVIVCTRNRALGLDRTLKSLASMVVPRGLNWELLIVDNGSSDDTRSVADGFMSRAGLHARYVCEPSPGLSRARNRGMDEARGDMLAFIDDDVLVESTWIGEIAREFDKEVGMAMLFGQTRAFSAAHPSVSVKEGNLR